MGLVMSILSVYGEEHERICKFCYGDEGPDSSWLHPCRCIGTLYWVHHKCFELWMTRASATQQLQCQTCKYIYQKSWVLMPPSEWHLPYLDLNMWQWVEILLDIYSTYKFVRGFIWTIEGRRSIFMQCIHFVFWRTFIMSDRRIAWYSALGRTLLSGIFNVNVLPYSEKKESTEEDELRDEQSRMLLEVERDA
ncbi:unnamed protein product [Caenorhabditis bovis]|uniref:RING-CH-type domain-containing protein n=1 Tax=Caenorhabditis bovis TaxID=2654633 RepID=A0A8S1ETE3_9PELO|nr:unnamed protein product [Caenorhabditis bovis]